ncbi:hypothetical protein EYF80_038894 [Liparis tanakae]|uniref:Uncharacterized protein n=1 Tax=Liparis tanakae TaxID=230148 RepID=A0A4Z2GDD3_9TELE|nr:hypothetical protein EYF80_038894 [Liparis tanakae]
MGDIDPVRPLVGHPPGLKAKEEPPTEVGCPISAGKCRVISLPGGQKDSSLHQHYILMRERRGVSRTDSQIPGLSEADDDEGRVGQETTKIDPRIDESIVLRHLSVGLFDYRNNSGLCTARALEVSTPGHSL